MLLLCMRYAKDIRTLRTSVKSRQAQRRFSISSIFLLSCGFAWRSFCILSDLVFSLGLSILKKMFLSSFTQERRANTFLLYTYIFFTVCAVLEVFLGGATSGQLGKGGENGWFCAKTRVGSMGYVEFSIETHNIHCMQIELEMNNRLQGLKSSVGNKNAHLARCPGVGSWTESPVSCLA